MICDMHIYPFADFLFRTNQLKMIKSKRLVTVIILNQQYPESFPKVQQISIVIVVTVNCKCTVQKLKT